MKLWGGILLGFFVFLEIFPQETQEITRPLYFNSTLYRLYQFVYPELFNNQDSLALKFQLHKLYSMQSYYEFLAKEKKIDTLRQTKNDLEQLFKILQTRYLAEYFRNNYSQTVNITEEEIRQYYERNKQQFETPGKASYIKVFIPRNASDGEKKARELLKMYMQHLPTQPDEVKKTEENGILLSYDHEMPLKNFNPFTPQLVNVKKGQLVGPFPYGEQNVILLVTDITPSLLRPFEEVKEICRANAISDKLSTLQREMEQKADSLFPVFIDPEMFRMRYDASQK